MAIAIGVSPMLLGIWFEKGVEEGFINQEAFDLLTFTDDLAEVEKGIISS